MLFMPEMVEITSGYAMSECSRGIPTSPPPPLFPPMLPLVKTGKFYYYCFLITIHTRGRINSINILRLIQSISLHVKHFHLFFFFLFFFFSKFFLHFTLFDKSGTLGLPDFLKLTYLNFTFLGPGITAIPGVPEKMRPPGVPEKSA